MSELGIKTNWVKCDANGCNLVAMYQIEYDEFCIMRKICPKHYEEYKEFLANWRVKNLK